MGTEFTRATLETILARLTDAVGLFDHEGVLTFVNTAGARLGLDKALGLAPADALAVLELRHADGRDGDDGWVPPAEYPVTQALGSGRLVSDRHLRLGAAQREVLLDALPLGPAQGGVAVVRAADAPERLRDRFVSVLSHELRAPLQPILGWTEVLRRHGNLDAVTARALDAIRRNIRQQVRLVDDLLDLSRIVHHELTLRYERFDLREHIRAAAEPFEENAALKRVRLVVTLPAGPVPMWGDGTRVQQITANLLSNAVTFTPPGGRIALTLTAGAHHAFIEVADTGEGIAAADLAVIFDVFRQGPGGRTGGLGLGLDLVRRLTELHGGAVRVESNSRDQGARFTVQLPLGVEHEPARPGAAADASRLDGRTILVIEDNDDTRDVLKYMLELEGARVDTAGSGDDGVRAAARLRPDVVLCDIGLPDIDGFEVARRIRDQDAGRGAGGPRLIALTGYGQADDVRNALQAGFTAHLTKPVNLDELLSLLYLDGARPSM